MERKALEFLESNELLHFGMIFPIKRGTVNIFYADYDGVFLKELQSGAYMLSSSCFDRGRALLDTVGKQALFCVHQELFADYLTHKYGYQKHLACLQAVYKQNKPLHNNSGILAIEQLGIESTDIIYSHYQNYVDYQYIKRRLECGGIYGGFLNGELCGFVGTHEEGSIGILEVFDKYRKRGFGEELESYMVNIILDRKQIPFAQISVDNEASIKLHKKLGFEISSDMLYWIF